MTPPPPSERTQTETYFFVWMASLRVQHLKICFYLYIVKNQAGQAFLITDPSSTSFSRIFLSENHVKITKSVFLSEKQFIVTQKLKLISFTKKSSCHRNKFPSQKQLSSKFLSEKHTSVTEKSFFIEKIVCHGQRFLSKNKSFCLRSKLIEPNI